MQYTQLLNINWNWDNVDRFSRLFHLYILKEILYVSIIKVSTSSKFISICTERAWCGFGMDRLNNSTLCVLDNADDSVLLETSLNGMQLMTDEANDRSGGKWMHKGWTVHECRKMQSLGFKRLERWYRNKYRTISSWDSWRFMLSGQPSDEQQ